METIDKIFELLELKNDEEAKVYFFIYLRQEENTDSLILSETICSRLKPEKMDKVNELEKLISFERQFDK